ncbi:DUF5992 family protein [Microbulbifer sp. TRSA005]|uniref:DUF5992 family protein n=1 Tax=unclassified Microbulbifer TaxID=2619833 RepID=UPI004039EAE0
MKKIITAALSFLCLSASFNSFAAGGFIVENAQVVKVSSTSNKQDAFWIWYTGGSNDHCNGKVKVQLNQSGTEGTFQRSFTLATTALVSEKKVNIYSYTDINDCLSAASIDLRK